MNESPAAITASAGHWLAGFVEAEGSFGIQRNNGGQSWTCTFALTQRDDEWDLLSQLQDLTRLGMLRPRPAVGSARPQVQWSITRQFECLGLVDILERFPLRGRKLREFEVWAHAVRTWVDITPREPSRWTRMATFADELRCHRRYVDPGPAPELLAAHASSALGWFIGGFVTGEGCFSLAGHRARFTLKVRRDDRRLLETIQRSTDLGYLYDGPANGSSRPTVSWIVVRHADLLPLADSLRGKLRGRRARELEAWSAAVDAMAQARLRPHSPVAQGLNAALDEFHAARQYRAPGAVSRRPHPAASSSKDWIERALRVWADEEHGPLSATRYSAWRAGRKQYPNRDTVTRLFGTWSAALASVGLTAREASTATARARRAAGRDLSVSATRRADDRARVAKAVAQLIRENGAEPTGATYFAWRLGSGRHLPSQATTYRLFPGGWAEVLAAARRL